GKPLPVPGLPVEKEKDFPAASFAPDGRTLAIGRTDGVHLVEVSSGKRLQHLTGQCLQNQSLRGWDRLSSATMPERLAFSPDGKLHAAGTAQRIVLWAVADGKEVQPVAEGHAGNVLSVAVSADGSRIASSGSDGTVRLWDTHGRELHR